MSCFARSTCRARSATLAHSSTARWVDDGSRDNRASMGVLSEVMEESHATASEPCAPRGNYPAGTDADESSLRLNVADHASEPTPTKTRSRRYSDQPSRSRCSSRVDVLPYGHPIHPTLPSTPAARSPRPRWSLKKACNSASRPTAASVAQGPAVREGRCHEHVDQRGFERRRRNASLSQAACRTFRLRSRRCWASATPRFAA